VVGDRAFYVSEERGKVDQLVLVLVNKESGNDVEAMQGFNAKFKRMKMETDTTLYMIICSLWFVGTIVMLFVSTELADSKN
jgi:hypothetical protein